MKRWTWFITGTDTGAGKTVFASLLTRHLRAAGVPAVALKPLCSGSRADARAARAAADGVLTLDEVNPWHFRSPLAPLLAARLEKRKVARAEVLAQTRALQKRFPALIIEGAGGLLSPLGEDFDSRDLIQALRATPIVVCPNRLGAVNQVLLVLAALPRRGSRRAQVVLTSLARPDAASRSNPQLLGEKIGRERVHLLPRLQAPIRFERMIADRRVQKTLATLVRNLT